MLTKRSLVVAGALALGLGLAALVHEASAEILVTSCRTITQPGKYRLTRNIEPTVPGSCLEIRVNDVEIDLDGHVITGKGGSLTAGIEGSILQSNIVVRNGTVRFFGRGVDLFEAEDVRVERMRLHNNSAAGIFVSNNAVLEGNIVTKNATGILVRPRSGFRGDGGRIANNIVSLNTNDGMRVEAPGALITGNVVRDNEDDGVFVLCPSSLIGNTITINGIGTGGVNLDFGGTTGCLVDQNLVGD